MKRPRHLLLGCLLLLALLALACSVTTDDDDFAATVDALSELVVATATARAGDELGPADLLSTAEASATEVVLTLVAEATERALVPTPTPIPPPPTPAPLPTQDASQPAPDTTAIEAELASLGVPPGGVLGWIHPPADVTADGPGQFSAVNDFGGPVTADFVVAADIIWGVAANGSGCGFMLRASSPAADSSGYFLLLTRGAGPQVQMLPRLNGVLAPEEASILEVAPTDPTFAVDDGGRNRLVVIASGPTLLVFSNGVALGEITPATTLGAGGVALTALSDGGLTACRFENSWLWLLDS